MRKLQRHLPVTVTCSALLSGLTAICLFIKGIWTPQWQGPWKCAGSNSQCWNYQANHQWLATAWLFVILAVLLAIGRVVMWRLEEEENQRQVWGNDE